MSPAPRNAGWPRATSPTRWACRSATQSISGPKPRCSRPRAWTRWSAAPATSPRHIPRTSGCRCRSYRTTPKRYGKSSPTTAGPALDPVEAAERNIGTPMQSNRQTRQTIVRLLSGMGSTKEISQYLKRFSRLDAARFAVVKVGGAVLRDELDALVSSLAFLQQVGLRSEEHTSELQS